MDIHMVIGRTPALHESIQNAPVCSGSARSGFESRNMSTPSGLT